MKKYTKPELDLHNFNIDVVLASNGVGDDLGADPFDY